MLELAITSDNTNAADHQDDYTITNATVVPLPQSTIDTPYGIRCVVGLHYDYSTTGDCRVTVLVR